MTYHISHTINKLHIMGFKALYLLETDDFLDLPLLMSQSQWPDFLVLTHIKFIPESGTLHLLERLLSIFLWLLPFHHSDLNSNVHRFIEVFPQSYSVIALSTPKISHHINYYVLPFIHVQNKLFNSLVCHSNK